MDHSRRRRTFMVIRKVIVGKGNAPRFGHMGFEPMLSQHGKCIGNIDVCRGPWEPAPHCFRVIGPAGADLGL